MEDIILAAIKWLEIQNKRFEADVVKYQQKINEVLSAHEDGPNEQRMLLGKIFIWVIKEEMEHGLVKAGIFGSTSRGKAHEESDVDIVLFVRPLTSEEKKVHNSDTLTRERWCNVTYCRNFAYNSHRINELERVFTEKTKIPVRCMNYEYNEKNFANIQKEIGFITIL